MIVGIRERVHEAHWYTIRFMDPVRFPVRRGCKFVECPGCAQVIKRRGFARHARKVHESYARIPKGAWRR